MDLKKTHEFVARGELSQNKIIIPAMVIGSYSDFASDPVQCKVIPDTGNFSEFGNLWDHTQVIEFNGSLEDGYEVWISNFRVSRIGTIRGNEYFEGDAELFIEARQGGLEDFDMAGGKITCSATIPFTPLALPYVGQPYKYSYDGTIKLSKENIREGVRWDTPLGQAELIDTYHYIFNETVGIHNAVVRVQECAVIIKTEIEDITSLKSILSDLPSTLDDALFLLSFIGRKRIQWFKALGTYHLDQDIRVAIARRRQWLGYESKWHEKLSWLDLLITKDSLSNGLFQQLLTNYQQSHVRETIDQTILYLFGTYEKAYFEAQLGTAYTALECLVSGMRTKGDDKINCFMDKKIFDRLVTKVNKIIFEEVNEPETAKKLIDKFRNARQNPYTDRLWNLLKKNNVDLGKLWSEGTDLKQELAGLIRRRNHYIHQGKLDEDKAYADLIRLRGIVELWILKLIDCPDTAVNQNAFRKAR